jgi:simple sugar transport system ATP-binding protein
MSEVVLECRNITKHYKGVCALRGVSFKLYKNEVLGIVGDNGAGKSTLIKILRGAVHPTSGEILLNGQRVSFQNPRDAMDCGIQCVYQDLALVDELSVKDNFFLGREIERKLFGFLPVLDEEAMYMEAAHALRQIGYEEIPLNAQVADLSGGQRQAVAIARAVFTRPEPFILLMDEPTSALSEKGKQKVFQFVSFLKKNYSIVLVTHDLNAALQACDRIIILKLGEIVFESSVHDGLSVEELISLM